MSKTTVEEPLDSKIYMVRIDKISNLTSLLKFMVEKRGDALFLNLEDHVEAVHGEDEVDGQGKEEHHLQ